MESMKNVSKEPLDNPEEAGDHPSAWKWPIRKRIWDMLEEKNLAAQPRCVYLIESVT